MTQQVSLRGYESNYNIVSILDYNTSPIQMTPEFVLSTINKFFPSSHIVKFLVDSFITIGKKGHSKYCNAACHVFSQENVKKKTRNIHLLKPTSKILKLNLKTST